ncbi:hypothetical protein DERF_000542 [Dermatophagoides farinae]|uniref:Sm domain-containing protein n=1 Tax=Dermatophagoides farinae TaxID=6954 RepID=A0A922LCI3_DERFA|nr:hypothetical protein DERF_000542 [Dermatophagoides farinae]
MDKRLSLKLNGNRQVTGILRGFDPFMNLVIDEAVEINKRNQQIPIEWNHQPLVMSTLTMSVYKEDFQANIENLLRFRMNKNPFIIELIGNCGQSIFTPYYPLGDMNNLRRILAIRKSNFNNRLLYCIEYVKILQFLHQNSMVMCDSNDLTKTLSQYLITDDDDDDDRLIIMNDLDALPNTNHGPIKCGHRPIVGDFVAPEQRYPNTYDDGYDHKTDIWKVPDVCHWIIKDDDDDDDQLRKLKITLFQQRLLDWIHQKCKSPKSIERPEAMEIIWCLLVVKKIAERGFDHQKCKLPIPINGPEAKM